MIHDPDVPASAAATADPSARSTDAAAVGPGAQPVSAADNPLPPPASKDSPIEAQGRRTLSTAFVRVGPDGLLTVHLRDGRAVVLRDVKMRARDYCGQAPSGGQFCGGYADVVGANPGGA